ncbi:MAG TPA: oxidoreductase, partial [Trueperaceae bacterium]|nr:oxidoreductase [Trueperaceae bacterium]
MARPRVPEHFAAFRVALVGDTVERATQTVPASVLPDHDVTVAVAYSSLNYKDALSASGNRGVSRYYPHTPGIDAAGTVIASRDPRFEAGDAVLCTGFDLGMNTPGGWSEYIRVPADWLVPLPAGLDLRAAMALGTAGVTAALAIDRLESVGVGPESG